MRDSLCLAEVAILMVVLKLIVQLQRRLTMAEYTKENVRELCRKILMSLDDTGLEELAMDQLMREYEADEMVFQQDWIEMQMENNYD
jgi:hypothetical protein